VVGFSRGVRGRPRIRAAELTEEAGALSRNPAPENFGRGEEELREQRGMEGLGFVDQRDGLCGVLGKDEAL